MLNRDAANTPKQALDATSGLGGWPAAAFWLLAVEA